MRFARDRVQRGGADSKEPRGRQLGRVPSVGRGRRRAPRRPRATTSSNADRERERSPDVGGKVDDDSRTSRRGAWTRRGRSTRPNGGMTSSRRRRHPGPSRHRSTHRRKSQRRIRPRRRGTTRRGEAAAPAPSAAATVSRSRSSSCVTSLVGGGARSSLASFDDLDTNGDGKLQTEEVAAALARGRRRRRRNRKRRRWFARSTPTATAR